VATSKAKLAAATAAVAAALEPIAREMFDLALHRRAQYQETLFAFDICGSRSA
jgi:hypothetical protein